MWIPPSPAVFLMAWSLPGSGGAQGALLKVLAVAGGAIVAGFLAGVFAQALFRSLTTRKAPQILVRVSQGGGGLISAWLLFLLLFGLGGSGMGGPGGWGLGGWGLGHNNEKSRSDGENKDKKESKEAVPPLARGEELAVEVLGKDTLLEVQKGDSFDPERRYRIREGKTTQLLTLDGVKQLLEQRLSTGQSPLRRVRIVLYLDSPAEGTVWVTDLRRYVADLAINDKEKMGLTLDLPDRKAPVN
jgi:hypothetical protein